MRERGACLASGVRNGRYILTKLDRLLGLPKLGDCFLAPLWSGLDLAVRSGACGNRMRSVTAGTMWLGSDHLEMRTWDRSRFVAIYLRGSGQRTEFKGLSRLSKLEK